MRREKSACTAGWRRVRSEEGSVAAEEEEEDEAGGRSNRKVEMKWSASVVASLKTASVSSSGSDPSRASEMAAASTDET